MTTVPAQLYKYQSGSIASITNLSAGKIWFSDPTRFNDPFDCALRIGEEELSFDAYKAEEEKLLADMNVSPADLQAIRAVPIEERHRLVAPVIHRKVDEGLDLIQGVSCFSATPYDLLMWGHYGDGHRGFCLEFDTEKDKPLFSKAKQVKYSHDRISLKMDRIIAGDLAHMLELLLLKAKCWEYEQEWRVLHTEKNTLFGYDRASLSRVIFGARMPEDQQLVIAKLLHGTTSTKFCRMHVDDFGFKLNAESVDFTPLNHR
jgi:hypothetical protein